MVKLFLVDDSQIVIEGLRAALSNIRGAVVIGHAATALGAIEGIRRDAPDVVILDIRLQSGSGFDVLQNLTAGGSRPCVIMLTNYPYDQYRKKARLLGADYFLDKVSDIELVPAIIRALAAGQKCSAGSEALRERYDKRRGKGLSA